MFRSTPPELACRSRGAVNSYREAAQEFTEGIPEANGRVSLFTPKVRDPNFVIPVCPPTGIHEIRPVLTQYGRQPSADQPLTTDKLPTRELTAYCHSLDNRPDHWSDIYPDDQPNPVAEQHAICGSITYATYRMRGNRRAGAYIQKLHILLQMNHFGKCEKFDASRCRFSIGNVVRFHL